MKGAWRSYPPPPRTIGEAHMRGNFMQVSRDVGYHFLANIDALHGGGEGRLEDDGDGRTSWLT